QRNDFPRRDCGDEPAFAGKALACASRRAVFAAGGTFCGERGCARARGDEYGREGSDAHRTVSRRFILPAECAFDSHSAAARADLGNPAAVPAFPGEVRAEISKAGGGAFETFPGSSAALFVAGKLA